MVEYKYFKDISTFAFMYAHIFMSQDILGGIRGIDRENGWALPGNSAVHFW